MINICKDLYPWLSRPLTRAACEVLARFYYKVVAGSDGAEAFKQANDERCWCTCENGRPSCRGACREQTFFQTTRDCGTCENYCGQGMVSCRLGVCNCDADTTRDNNNCG